MADLVTHVCTGLLPAAVFWPRAVVPLTIGTVLPDLTGRVPQMGLVLLKIQLPDRILWALDVAHTPIAQILFACLVGQLFREDLRRGITGWLLLGVGLHFGLDILQDHHGNGYYLWFPFSVSRFELGWVGSEATVAWAPWMLFLSGVCWGLRWAWERRSGREGKR